MYASDLPLPALIAPVAPQPVSLCYGSRMTDFHMKLSSMATWPQQHWDRRGWWTDGQDKSDAWPWKMNCKFSGFPFQSILHEKD